MRRLLLLSIVIFALMLFISCKKEKPVAIKKEVTKTATVDYVTSLTELPSVKNLEPGDILIKFIVNDVNTPGVIAIIGKFKTDCRYGYLYNILDQTNASAVWVAPSGSHLLIENQQDLKDNYDFFEKFKILDKNRIWVQISDTIYFKNSNGKFLRTD